MVQGEFWKRKRLVPKESQVELQICHYLHFIAVRLYKDFFFWKNPTSGYFDSKLKRFKRHLNPFALNGSPDIICIYKGQFIGVEVKVGKNPQSSDQKLFEQCLKNCGASYFVVHNIKELYQGLTSLGMVLPEE